MELLSALIAAAFGAIVGAVVGILAGRRIEARQAELTRGTAQSEVRGILEAAEREAGTLKRSAELAGKEEGFRLRDEQLRDLEDRRVELERLEKRLAEREESLEKKLDVMDQRQERVASREESLLTRETDLDTARKELDQEKSGFQQRLETLAGMTAQEARSQLIERIEEEAKADAAQTVREIRERSRREAEREAKKIIAMSIQRMAVDHSSEITVSVVPLPSDDMKGRIIGREGRNIRSFEHATGVDVVVDDTPEAVILSSFDPIRREVARIAMERLVSDGRIHPGRIEEVVEKASEDVKAEMHEAAELVLYELGIHGLHPQLIEVLGHLR